MASVIGYVKTVEEGTFFAKDANGNVRQLKAGDAVHQGELVYGAPGNTAVAKIFIDATLHGKGELVIAGNQALHFDTSVLKNVLSEDDSVVAAKDAKTGKQTDAGDETASGEETARSERVGDTFASRDGLVGEVNADVYETSAQSADANVQSDVETMLVPEEVVTTVEAIAETETMNSVVQASIVETGGSVVELPVEETSTPIDASQETPPSDAEVVPEVEAAPETPEEETETGGSVVEPPVEETNTPIDASQETPPSEGEVVPEVVAAPEIPEEETETGGSVVEPPVEETETPIDASQETPPSEGEVVPEVVAAPETPIEETETGGSVVEPPVEETDAPIDASQDNPPSEGEVIPEEAAPVYHPTAVVSDSVTTDEDVAINIDVLANDTDADAKSSVVSVTQGANGAVEINENGTIRYTPNTNWSGNDSFTYTNAEGNTATVNLHVVPVADAVLLEGSGVMTVEPVSFSIGDSDDSYVSTSNTYRDELGNSVEIAKLNNNQLSGQNITSIEMADGTIISTQSDSFYFNSGNGIGVNGDSKGQHVERVNAGDSVTFTFPNYTNTITIEFKNTMSNDMPVTLYNQYGEPIEGITSIENSTGNNGETILTFESATPFNKIEISGDNDSDGFFIGSIYTTDVKTPELPTTYPLDIRIDLKDIDGSEAIHSITLKDFPDGTVLIGEGISQNDDGSWNVPLENHYDADTGTVSDVWMTTTADVSNFQPTLMVETADTIEGQTMDTGVTVLGGTGDTVIVLDSNVKAVDGGEGFDTLLLTTDINLSALENHSVRNIEALDIANHEISLKLEDVLNMTDGSNELYIFKDSNGTVILSDGAQWTKTADAVAENVNGSEHVWDVYHSAVDATVTLKIETDAQHTL